MRTFSSKHDLNKEKVWSFNPILYIGPLMITYDCILEHLSLACKRQMVLASFCLPLKDSRGYFPFMVSHSRLWSQT